MTFITPYAPREAETQAKLWMSSHKQPAFIMAYSPPDGGSVPVCKNCQGNEYLYLKLCSGGPYKAPLPGKNVYTWFDGNGQYGKGWYVIDRTLGFECPECHGRKA